MNLAVNARDAMPEGGAIAILAKRAHVHIHNGLKPGDYVCLSVRDEGAGMDQETLAKAVEPFFTTKGIGKGTGLGLSMVVGMAEQFGGKATIESTLGEGTTFTLWLPVATDQSPSLAPLAAPLAPVPMKALTVLAVDDDDIILFNTAAMLADMGHTVLQATSGAQAMRMFAANRVDLLLTDYAMPDMNGNDLADAVQAGWPDLPIVVVSGYAELPAGLTLRFPRLAKPFRQSELSAAIVDAMPALPSGDVVSFRPRA